MTNYEIIANDIKLDTNDLNISLNYEIENILSIDKRSTNWTKTIVLPGTPSNNKFFNHLFDVNINTTTFNPSKSTPAILKCDGNVIFTGHLQLVNINVLHKTVSYEVTVMGILSNFFGLINNKYLSDLDMSRFNHKRDRDTIIKSFNYGIYENNQYKENVRGGEGYVYPYIIYGLTTDLYHNTFLKDWFPAVYDKTIIKQIFKELNINIKSKWLESDYASKLIYPFTNDKLQYTGEQLSKMTAIVGINNSLEYSRAINDVFSRGSAWKDNGSNFINFNRNTDTVDNNGSEFTFTDTEGQFMNGAYQCYKTGYYDISFVGKLFAQYTHDNGDKIKYNTNSNSFEYGYFLEKKDVNNNVVTLASSADTNNTSGTLLFKPSNGNNHDSPWIDLENSLLMNLTASSVLLNAGDIISVRLKARYPDGVKWNSSGGNDKIKMELLFKKVFDGEFTNFSIVPNNNESLGNEDINMNQILSNNIKQSDYILDLVKQFDLIMVDDKEEPNTLIIEPRKDYFGNKQRILDYDKEKKLDYSAGYKITPMSELDATSYKFTYSDDGDYFNKEYSEETKKIFGEKLIEVNNDFSDKTKEIKLGIATTPNSSLYLDGRVAPFFVTKDGENFKQFKAKPRRLFYGGMMDNSYLLLQEFPGSPIFSTINGYPYCGMWDHPTNPSHTLEFGGSDKIYWNSNIYPNNNLYEEFHSTTINNIINPNSKLFEGKFRLSAKDIAEFDFRNIVFLMGQYWRVNQIKNYDPSDTSKLTTMVLYNINDYDILNSKHVNIPKSNKSCPVDMIVKRQGKRYIQASKSGQKITKDCCNSVGGTFKDGVCYIPSPIIEGTLDPGGIGGPINNGGGVKDNVIPIRGHQPVLPTTAPMGPVSGVTDGNVILSPGVKVNGTGNYVASGVENTVTINGNNSTVQSGVKNVFVLGDNQSAVRSNVMAIQGTEFDEAGITRGNSSILMNDLGEVNITSDSVVNFESPQINIKTLQVLDSIVLDPGATINTPGGVVGGLDYLPLAGGTMSGPLIIDSAKILSLSTGNVLKMIGVDATNNIVDAGPRVVKQGSGANSLISDNASTNIGSGDYSIAMGDNNIASNIYSIAMGAYNNVTGSRGIGLGELNVVSNNFSIAIGCSNETSGQGGASIGRQNKVYKNYGFAAGYNNTSDGNSSISMGGNNNAIGDYSIALGRNNNSSQYAFAIGDSNTASNYQATAIGFNNNVSGDKGVGIGKDNIVTSARGVALGDGNTVSATGAVALGRFLTANVADTTFVDGLNIKTLSGGGASVNNLGIDSNGKVVIGTSGGAGSNIVYDTYANINTMRLNSTLVPGKFYYITDKDIILTAVKGDLIDFSGVRIQRIIKNSYYTPSTTTIGSVTINVLGIYGQTIIQGVVPNSNFTNRYYSIWGGRVWRRDDSGSDIPGTSDAVISAGWTAVPLSNNTYYTYKLFSINYDFETDYIFSQADERGNVFTPNTINNLSYFNKSDWGNDLIKGNKCAYILNNYSGSLPANINRNNIIGSIYANKLGVINDNFNRGSIYENSVIQILGNYNLGDIDGNNSSGSGGIINNGNAGHIRNNNIANGKIIYNENNGNIIDNTRSSGSLNISANRNNGWISKNNGGINIIENINNGNIGSITSLVVRTVDIKDTRVNK